MHSHFLICLSAVASPSIFDTHTLILSQLSVHAVKREDLAGAHKHKQTGFAVYDNIL